MFNVGDIVCGTNRNGYMWDNAGATKGIVVNRVNNQNGDLYVKILEHPRKDLLGKTYVMHPKYLELVKETTMFNIGDIICGTDQGHYKRTNKSMTKGRVIVHVDQKIRIEILEHQTHPEYAGEIYVVKPEHFRLYDLNNEQKIADIRAAVSIL